MPLLVDLLILAYLAFSLWRGYRAGLLVGMANLLGLVVSLTLAFAWYQPLAQLIQPLWNLSLGILNIFAFLLLAFVIDALLNGLILFSTNRLKQPQYTWLTAPSYGAAALGLSHALILLTYFVGIFISVPIDHPSKKAVQSAILAQPIIKAIDYFNLPITNLITPAISEISQLFTISPDSDEVVKLNFTSQNPQLSTKDEQELLRLVNQERAKLNLSQLTLDLTLQAVGRAHSLDMFRRGYFSHHNPEGQDPFDRLKAHGVHYHIAGENLALAPTVAMAHTGLMNSPGHRRNILEPKYNRIGIGAYKDSKYGIMFTQVFSN